MHRPAIICKGASLESVRYKTGECVGCVRCGLISAAARAYFYSLCVIYRLAGQKWLTGDNLLMSAEKRAHAYAALCCITSIAVRGLFLRSLKHSCALVSSPTPQLLDLICA